MRRLGLSHLIDVSSVDILHGKEVRSPRRGKWGRTPDSLTSEPGYEATSQQALGPTSWTWPMGEGSTQGSMYEESQPYIPQRSTSMT